MVVLVKFAFELPQQATRTRHRLDQVGPVKAYRGFQAVTVKIGGVVVAAKGGVIWYNYTKGFG